MDLIAMYRSAKAFALAEGAKKPKIQDNIYPSAKIWTRGTNQPAIIKINHYMYDHPKERKTLQVASYVLGAAALGSGALTGSPFVAMGLLTVGSLVTAITYLAGRTLNCMVPMRHDMKNLAFCPDKLEKQGRIVGELYYDGLVPVLKINTSDPKESGYTQGYLLQHAISSLRANAEFCIFTLARQKRPSEVAKALNIVKSTIPECFLVELEGMVEGYNAKKGRFERAISLDDLLYLQLMPDTMYFHPENFETIRDNQKHCALDGKIPANPVQAVACTLLALQDQQGAPLIARTMDWQSFGIAGKFSLVISRLYEEKGIRTAEVGIPGLIGTLTGVNNKGISVAMNVTDYHGKVNTIEGMPSSFYNRRILEECSFFSDAERFIQLHRALGPYHLTVSDAANSGTFSLYQNEDWTGNWSEDKKNSYCLRLLSNDEPLITTNCSCTPRQQDMFNGKYREVCIKKHLTENQQITNTEVLLKHSQSIPWVNNHLTTHRILMGHQTLEVSFDNAWAGDRDLHSVNLKKLFSM